MLIPWWQIGIFRFDISYVSSYISRRPTHFSHFGCLQFDVCKNFERAATNRNSRFAAAAHLSTFVISTEWTNGERSIIFSRSRVRALHMIVGRVWKGNEDTSTSEGRVKVVRHSVTPKSIIKRSRLFLKVLYSKDVEMQWV